jgi:hypothetical protein
MLGVKAHSHQQVFLACVDPQRLHFIAKTGPHQLISAGRRNAKTLGDFPHCQAAAAQT